MKKGFLRIITVLVVVSLLSSCSPKLVGTWNISRYETTGPGEQKVSMSNIGTMTFRKNGEGEKNINYTVFGRTRYDNSRFGWHSTGPYLGIESPDSEFSRTWTILTNKRKEQKWKTTDGVNRVQILELKK